VQDLVGVPIFAPCLAGHGQGAFMMMNTPYSGPVTGGVIAQPRSGAGG
jgi:hypothetical protein